jgi:hypothetical protein
MLNGRTILQLTFAPDQSFFVVFRKKGKGMDHVADKRPFYTRGIPLNKSWMVSFDTAAGGPSKPVRFDSLVSWTVHSDTSIRYYSGTAIYRTSFDVSKKDLGFAANIGFTEISNIASVRLNGKDCGTVWTKPYLLSVKDAIREGENILEIEVANTWANRLIGDQRLEREKRITWTTAPFRLAGKPLQSAGIIGKVELILYSYVHD